MGGETGKIRRGVARWCGKDAEGCRRTWRADTPLRVLQADGLQSLHGGSSGTLEASNDTGEHTAGLASLEAIGVTGLFSNNLQLCDLTGIRRPPSSALAHTLQRDTSLAGCPRPRS